MNTTKDEIIEMISHLPSEVTPEDIMEEIYFRIKVDKSLARLEAGEGISQEEIEKRFSKWLE